MTPDEIVAAFGRATGLITELMKTQRGQSFKPIVIEAKVRLEQSTILLEDFRRAELDYSVLRTGPTGFRDAASRLRLYGEAFYYFSWRAHKALAKCGVNFVPVGVRHVRNKMIEHPDKSDGIPVLCWATACPQGLVLEPEGPDSTPGADPGLYPNAQEYIEKLIPRLEDVVSPPTAPK